jgi:hypothetical protein
VLQPTAPPAACPRSTKTDANNFRRRLKVIVL